MVQTIHGDPFVDQILMGNSEPLLIGMVALIHLSNRVSVATEISAPSSQRDMKAKVKRIPRLERMFPRGTGHSALCCDLTRWAARCRLHACAFAASYRYPVDQANQICSCVNTADVVLCTELENLVGQVLGIHLL